MADEQAMARVRMWWAGLDADTQMMFDRLYRIDPANVLAVISNGALTDLGAAATLDEAFTYPDPVARGAEGADPFVDQRAVPVIIVKDGLVIVEPVAPAANEQVTVRWTEVNDGAASQGHLSTVAWFVDNQWVDPVLEVVGAPMGPGEEVERTVTLPGVLQGEHFVYVTSNADGNVTGGGAIPEAGIGAMAAAMIRVAGGSRPDIPEWGNVQGLTEAFQYLAQAYQSVGDHTSVLQAAQALYSFAGTLDTGGVGREEGEGREMRLVQDDDASIRCVQRAQALEALDLTGGWRDDLTGVWREELSAAYEAVGAATADPWAGGQAAFDAMIAIGSGSFGLG